MPHLSICRDVTQPTHAAPTRAALQALIPNVKDPMLCADPATHVSADWAHVGIGNLLEVVGPQKFLRLMVSPTGVFGFYDGNVPTDVRDGRIYIKPGTQHSNSNEELEVPHIRFEADAPSMMRQWATKGPGDYFITPEEHYYFRSIGGVLDVPRIARALPDCIPRDRRSLREVNLYLSQPGTVTNMHYDPVSGAICQLKGRKRAILFPPEQAHLFEPYAPEHFFGRRCKHAERLTQAVVNAHPAMQRAHGFAFIIEANQWLLVPKGWLHTIETMDADTVSLIVTFAA